MTGDERFASFLIGRAKPGLAVTAFIAATLLLVAASLLLVAGSANRTEARRVQDAVALELSGALDQLRRLTSDYSFWDDALRRLVTEPDLTWADENVGSHLARQYEIDATYVLTPDGGIALAYVDGTVAEVGGTPFSERDLAPLLGALPPSDGTPYAAGTILAVDGQAYLTYASRIAGNSPEGRRHPASGSHYLLLQRRLDAAVLETLQRGASAQAVHVSIAAPAEPTPAEELLAAVWGPAVLDAELPRLEVPTAVRVEVVPLRPGLGILADILVPFLLMLSGLSAFGGLLVRSVRRVQRQKADLERAKLEAERASRAKTEFLANISHELRTPLNTVIGFADVLADEAAGKLTAEQADYVRDIRASGEHLLAIINDLLDMSRIEAGAMTVHDGVFDLGRVVAGTARMMREQALSVGVTLEAATPDGPLAVRADERLIRQVMLNLIANAVKFTEPGGTVRVTAGRRADGTVWATVADTGIGIAPEQIAMVFKPFYQVDSSLSRKRGGTGLGLPISKAIMALHGGDLDIASRPGQGTTISAILPAARAAEAKEPAARVLVPTAPR